MSEDTVASGSAFSVLSGLCWWCGCCLHCEAMAHANVMLQEIGRRPSCTLLCPVEWRHKQHAQSLVLSCSDCFCKGLYHT